jgi:Holliday junction resolvasome RuvABC DNA-binding subunit
MLGFPKNAVEKLINQLLAVGETGSVEDLIKRALKKL